jgi:hypothetical protein
MLGEIGTSFLAKTFHDQSFHNGEKRAQTRSHKATLIMLDGGHLMDSSRPSGTDKFEVLYAGVASCRIEKTGTFEHHCVKATKGMKFPA